MVEIAEATVHKAMCVLTRGTFLRTSAPAYHPERFAEEDRQRQKPPEGKCRALLFKPLQLTQASSLQLPAGTDRLEVVLIGTLAKTWDARWI